MRRRLKTPVVLRATRTHGRKTRGLNRSARVPAAQRVGLAYATPLNTGELSMNAGDTWKMVSDAIHSAPAEPTGSIDVNERYRSANETRRHRLHAPVYRARAR